ncbi:outer membrane efflux protein [Tolypothrix tenuis PCC 7101]|uniref:Outer membrane efflux protein n=1 Tax=Tolypothrix tenuis PCC 7101 TaxID=231146 RepID=A0A1Z4N909_9CYAN|nr:TolC family protein [Aulosira sp. FACHB-113]BAZ02204.1 outer membrane efflux protein [Tolypothrix tenuis PCC 7101]BAZ73875.1 outer membrane efflux protein [Aulosira laxa NIES-50]
MNFILFRVHSTWVTLLVAVLMTTLAKSANAETTAQTLQSPSPTVNNSRSIIDNLSPNPNPLLFPTKPEEVRIQGTVPLSLAQALELARRNNPTLQASQFQVERSRSALREAQAALLPNANVSGNLANSGSNLFTGGSTQSSTAFNGQAQVNYNLYTSGNRQANIRSSEEQVRIDELNLENQSLVVGLNVATQYYNLQGADEQVRINRSAVENAQASLRDTQARLQAGVGTQFDVLQAQVNLANAQQQLTNSIANQQIARRQFGTLLNLPQSVDITAADPVQLAGLWQQTLEQTIVQAFQNRPELPQFLAQRNQAEQQRRQALSQLGPQLGVTGTYNFRDIYNDAISVVDGYSVGLQSSLTLFDGGAARARAAQSRANIAIAETQFANQRDQIRFDVEQFYFQLQSNLENVQTSTLALSQAREALQIARLRFQAGVGTQTEVIAAENDLTRAEGNRVTAILDYNRALASLQRSVTSRATR